MNLKSSFLTQESSADVVQEVRNLGARDYFVKMAAASELFTAVEGVLSGKTFVTSTQAN
jgi:DNA-binding NarL/FixJ family response regulator